MSGYDPWPTYALPAPPLNDSYSVGLADLSQRTELEQGPAHQRQIFRNGPTQYNITWPMTPAQFELFKGFSKNILCGGNKWFTMPVFDGLDYVTRTVRFVAGPIKPTRDGGEWMTSAVLETMDDVSMDENTTILTLVGWGSTDDPLDIIASFHNCLHGSYPAAGP